jgi:hypothetical protein
MRDMLIKQILDLEAKTDLTLYSDYSRWSNKELLERYGDLRIEEEYMIYTEKMQEELLKDDDSIST